MKKDKNARVASLLAAIVVLFGVLFVAACTKDDGSKDDGDDVIVRYTVSFYSDDGIELLHSQVFESGAEIVYGGETPVKTATDDFVYEFEGWSENIGGEIESGLTVSGDIDLYAIFDERAKERRSVVKPVADDSAFAYNGENVVYGIPQHDDYYVYGSIQTDAGEYTVTVALKNKKTTRWADGSDENLTFPFVIGKAANGWSVDPAVEDYNTDEGDCLPVGAAQYGDVVWSYCATPDGSFGETAPAVKGVYYAKATVAESDNWLGLEKTVRFEVFSNKYTVNFVDYDGGEITSLEIAKNGAIAPDITPERTGDAQYSYTFIGWSDAQDGEAAELFADEDNMTVYAVYERTVNRYDVVFRDTDGVKYTVKLDYGATPQYGGESLDSGDGNIITSLIGWSDGDNVYDGELPTVTANVEYRALYAQTFNPAFGTDETNAYEFSKASEMVFLSEYIACGNSVSSKYFALSSDIDLSDVSDGLPIGSADYAFDGHFDGRGNTLTVSGTHGIFGVNSGVVENVKAVADISGGDVAGAIANVNRGEVINCISSGVVGATECAGGIVGINGGTVRTSKSTAIVSVDGEYAMTAAVGDGGGVVIGRADGGHSIVYAESVWDGSAASAFESGDGSESSPYIIASAQQLAYLKDSNSANGYYAGKHIRLDCDVDLADITWNGIGGTSTSGGFKGVFDGNGHTVFNAKLGYAKNRGFFNSAAAGIIKNLTLFGSASGTGDITYLGVLIGLNTATIDNCAVYADVDASGTYISAVAGWTTGNISGCSAYGRVVGSNVVGGVVGYDALSGGKIGNIYDCVNYASVISNAAYGEANVSGIGGIVALIGSGATVGRCVNYGTVKGTNVTSSGGTGGIVGNLFKSAVDGCANYGTIQCAESAAGGIVGYGRLDGSITDCDNYGNVSANFAAAGISGMNRSDIASSVNHGNVSGTGESYWIGGVSGMQGGNGATVNGCRNEGRVIGAGSIKGGVGGIAGSSYSGAVISECENTEFVVGNDGFCGGLVGENRSGASVVDCVNGGGNALFGSDAAAEELVYGNVQKD